MECLFCSACAQWLKRPDLSFDLLVFCPDCGQCLDMPADWTDVLGWQPSRVTAQIPAGQVSYSAKGRVGVLHLPSSLRSATELGSLREVHQTRRDEWVEQISYGIFGLPLLLFLAVAACITPERFAKSSHAWLEFAAAFFGLGTLFVFALWNFLRPQSLLLFADGLVRLKRGAYKPSDGMMLFCWQTPIRVCGYATRQASGLISTICRWRGPSGSRKSCARKSGNALSRARATSSMRTALLSSARWASAAPG